MVCRCQSINAMTRSTGDCGTNEHHNYISVRVGRPHWVIVDQQPASPVAAHP
jgi:hypothetical protein